MGKLADRAKVRSVILCDDIRKEANGKLMLMGVYSGGIVVPKLPALLPRLVIRVEFEMPPQATKAGVVIKLIDPNDMPMMEIQTDMDMMQQSSASTVADCAFGLNGVPFEKPGRYRIAFGVDRKPKEIYWFDVKEGVVTSPI